MKLLYFISSLLGVLCMFFGSPTTAVVAATTGCPPAGDNLNIGDSVCTISADTVSGVDVASGTNNIGVLTLDGTGNISINACGQLLVGSVVISGTGAYISVQDPTATQCAVSGTLDGGKILLNAPLYMTDADSDGYPADTTMYATTTTGRRRITDLTSVTSVDCDDANATYFANLTCYADADSDTYYAKTTTSVCGGATCASVGMSATVGTDCCDSDNRAYPGGGCQTTASSCGDWDFDCDGTSGEKCTTSSYSCTSPCSGCATSANVTSGGWTGGNPSCGNGGSYNMVDGSHSGNTCYDGQTCSGISYGVFTKTQSCK